jgi:mono/diheme cytochrome c family protein
VATAVGGIAAVRLLPGLEPLAAGLVLTMTALIAAGFGVSAARQAIPVTASTHLANPIPAGDDSIRRGGLLYVQSCLVCHGPAGAGVQTDDPAHAHGAAADLTDRRSRARRDGDLYHAITAGVGGSAIPAYDVAQSEHERWDLVNYLRALQRRGSS